MNAKTQTNLDQDENRIDMHCCTICGKEFTFIGEMWMHTTKNHSDALPVSSLLKASTTEFLLLLLAEQNFSFEDNTKQSSLDVKDMLNKQNIDINALYKNVKGLSTFNKAKIINQICGIRDKINPGTRIHIKMEHIGFQGKGF